LKNHSTNPVLKKLIFLTENETVQQDVINFLAEWYSPSSTIIVKTSGSTGSSKEISISKKHMRISALKTISTFSVKEGGTAFLCLSTKTIAGKMMIIRAIENQMTLYVGDIHSNKLSNFPIAAFDLLAIVPLQLETCLNYQPDLIKYSSTVLVGGGPVSSEQINQLTQIGATIYHTYGMTETLSHIAFRSIGMHTQEYYTVLSGVVIYSKNGCLVINYPELNIFDLQTSDLVAIEENKQFRLTGRADFVINSGGVKFNPEELESRISGVIENPYFIAGLPDSKLGERIVLVIESLRTKDEGTILERIKPLLPIYGCPKEIRFLPKFARTESMKIKRKETLELL